MRRLLLLCFVAACLCAVPPETFQKCQAGSYDVRIRAGQSSTYTTIPKGVVGLQILLSAIPYDVDLTMLNSDSTKWLVFPCTGLRCTALISSGTAATTTWKDTTISYSGFKGIETGKPGVEWLEVTGELKEDIKIGLKININRLTVPIPIAMRIMWSGAEGCAAPPAEGVDLKVITNSRNHKTYLYRGVPKSTLILRRGLPFSLALSMNGATPENTQATVGDLAGIPGAIEFKDFTQVATNQVAFTGLISPNAPVGYYVLKVTSNGKTASAYLVILFNPYLPEDAAYLPDVAMRSETVENEEGIIWQGSTYQLFPTIFHYDQFEWDVLATAIYLIRRMPVPERSNLVLVSRHLTYAIGNDLCYGKWGVDPPPFEEGQPEDGYLCGPNTPCRTPTYWKSIAEMARVHRAVKRMPVQYCQCFVFAATTTGVGRSLGIATRPVTNFQSAHDKNFNRAIDKFFINISGRLFPFDGPIEESVWNFHVWNEMYMTRADLNVDRCAAMGLGPNCGDGWQVLDSTPQEISEAGSGTPSGEGFYMLGPASVALVKANKHGVCEIKELNRETHPRVGCYDANFVISEVNANFNVWIAKGPNQYEQKCYKPGPECGYPVDPLSIPATVGQYMSTKAPVPISNECRARGHCYNERLDVTPSYKKPEPSWSTTSRGRHMWMLEGEADAEVDVGTIPSSATMVINELGSIFSAVGLVVKIKSSAEGVLDCVATVSATDYRGRPVQSGTNSSIVGSLETTGKVVNGEGVCLFVIARDLYRKFTSSRFGNAAKASTLKFVVSTLFTTSDGKSKTYMEERNVHLCTPHDPLEVATGRAMCGANAGVWRGPVRAKCPEDEDPKRGNGKCDDELNNEANCYDNGDCCAISCLGRFAGVEGGHQCPTDDSKCSDPAFKAGFDLPAVPGSFVGQVAELSCERVTNAVKEVMTKSCANRAVCDSECSQALSSLVCLQNKWEEFTCSSLNEALKEFACEWPRCEQQATHAGSGFNVFGDGHTSTTSEVVQFGAQLPALMDYDTPPQQESSMAVAAIVPVVVAATMGLVVGALVGAVATRRRQVVSSASLL